MDTCTPTEFTRRAVADRLHEGSVILFDELCVHPGWRHREYKALQEILPRKSGHFPSFSKESVATRMTAHP